MSKTRRIGFLNDLFYELSHIAAPAELSIPVLLDEKSTVVPVRLAGEQSGGKRKVSYGAARSNSERAAPSAWVGKRLSAPQIGTAGLLERPMKYQELDLGLATGNLLRQGGTILGTVNKGNPFAYPMPDGSTRDRSDEVIAGFVSLGLEALIGIGGDGSMRILSRLARQGNIPFVGIPKTIDNDVACTDFAIGYMSAVDVAVEALDRLQPTAASHRRVMLLEVMGRDVGWIAIHAGIAGGADVVLIPEIPFTIDKVTQKLRSLAHAGHNHALMVVAEGIRLPSDEAVTTSYADGEVRYRGVSHHIADLISEQLGAETRVTELGYVQRGGSPNSFDRMLASAFGVRAVDLVAAGKTDRVVVWQSGVVTDVPLDDVAGKTRGLTPDHSLIQTAREMGICLGD
jgi:ATP-dependent phosphofructokinase / diphosphate-dependent phosphofructokinase